MTELVKTKSLDLWVCNQYKVLPTEERFKALGDEQKYMLFLGFMEQPLPEQIHKAYRNSKASIMSNETVEGLGKAGYSPEQLERIQSEMEKAGL